ncbi:unnamed protein product [Phytophthora fragariaefolia]|uniref:Unnamed protein product n=1 Tax=Phytophthora fragariaefolia TaxID=1490495 RepID=A0A9W6XH97_9STRA|nr:unnamed protein product [Phytophthora fragariaefolia]
MHELMAKNINEEKFAKQLGVYEKMQSLTETGGTGLVQFMNTKEYKQFSQYQEFLIAERRKALQQAHQAQRSAALKKSKSFLSKKWFGGTRQG